MSAPDPSNAAATASSNHAFGVDIGGSGVKGGIIDLTTGELVGDRYKVLTPQPATPDAVAGAVKEVVEHFSWEGPVGITVPSVVKAGVTKTAANIDKTWVELDSYGLFAKYLGDRQLSILNDADAAGLAEEKWGAGADYDGVVLLLTFGTGIGSALLVGGVLFPNTEFGHLEVNGKEAEHRAASSVKEAKDWSYEKWAEQVSKVLIAYEVLLWPEVIIAGGGISRKADKWIPLLTNSTPVIPAKLENTAGIAGAALAVSTGLRP